jgi:hypothetical protein
MQSFVGFGIVVKGNLANRLGDWSDRPRLNRTPFWFPTVGGYSEFGCGLVKDVTKCSGGSNVESGPREVRPATCL